MVPHPFQSALARVEMRSSELPWARERPWRCESHLGWERGLPLIDLHDLSVRLALEAIRALLAAPPDQGGWVVITGRGKHGGGRSPLRDAVQALLMERADAGELVFYPQGPGRFEVVVDPDAVRAARPGMGLMFWLFVLLLLCGIAFTVWNALGGP